MKITVTGTIGEWKAGTVLNNDTAIAQYYRAIVNEDRREGPVDMTDADILKIVSSVEGDTEEAEIERIGMIDKGEVPATEQEVSVAISSNRDAEAEALAELIGKSPSFNASIEAIVEATERAKRGPIETYLELKNVLGPKLAELPKPETTADGRKIKRQGEEVATEKSNNPDWYWVPGRTARNKPTTKRHSFVEEVALKLPISVALAKEIEEKEKIWPGNKREQVALDSRNSKRLSTVKANVTGAAWINAQVMAIEGYASAVIRFKMVTDKKTGKEMLASMTDPIIISKADDATVFDFLTYQEFMSLDVVRAKTFHPELNKEPGTYEALIATMKREKKEEKIEFPLITAKTFVPAVFHMIHAFQNPDTFDLVRKMVSAEKTQKETLDAIGRLKEYFESLETTTPEVEAAQRELWNKRHGVTPKAKDAA